MQAEFRCSLEETLDSSYVRTLFNRCFRGKAHCGRCGGTFNSFAVQRIKNVEKSGRAKNFVVCECQNYVWRIAGNVYRDALGKIQDYEGNWRRRVSQKEARASHSDAEVFQTQTSDHKRRRRQLEKDAIGKHTEAEMTEILSLQMGRCFYCNRRFTDELKRSRDHILPLVLGGTHFAWNLLAVCRSCNSRKQEIPFLTYCRLLNMRQYKAMMKHLERRMDFLIKAKLKRDQLLDLYAAFTLDDPKHEKYLFTLKIKKRRRFVARLMDHHDRKMRQGARNFFSGEKSWVATTVRSAILEALLVAESEKVE
jgi:5-methylcytosine-specific restriction endonuclease McrA